MDIYVVTLQHVINSEANKTRKKKEGYYPKSKPNVCLGSHDTDKPENKMSTLSKKIKDK